MRVKTEEYLNKLTVDSKDAALKTAQDAQLPVGEASAIAENRNYQVTLNVTDPSKTQEIIDEINKKGISILMFGRKATTETVSLGRCLCRHSRS